MQTTSSSSSSSVEERERKVAEERAQQAALRLQRKQRLQALVRKRKSNLIYLKVITELRKLKLKKKHVNFILNISIAYRNSTKEVSFG
jgi:pheromone shutdown protein TraB